MDFKRGSVIGADFSWGVSLLRGRDCGQDEAKAEGALRRFKLVEVKFKGLVLPTSSTTRDY